VILDFSRENKDLRSSLIEMESHVQSLGSEVLAPRNGRPKEDWIVH